MTCEEYIKRHGLEHPVSKPEAVTDLLSLPPLEYNKLRAYWGKDNDPYWGEPDDFDIEQARVIESYKRMGEHDYNKMYKDAPRGGGLIYEYFSKNALG